MRANDTAANPVMASPSSQIEKEEQAWGEEVEVYEIEQVDVNVEVEVDVDVDVYV